MKKNIMVLVSKLANGGAEKAAIILAENLSKKYNVYLTVFDNSVQDYETNTMIIDLKTPITDSFIEKTLNFFKRLKYVKKLKKQYKIDCSISFLTWPNLINVLSKKQDKTVISIRNNMQEKSYIENRINLYNMKKADKIVTVSEEMRKFHIKHDKVNSNKIVTIYNVCNLEKIQKYLESSKYIEYEEIFKDGKVIISLGRYIKQKGQWHLIKAFSEIVKEYKDYKLVIFGRGENKDYLKKLVEELSLNKNIYLLEFTRNPYIYLKQSLFFVFPSLFEGCPNALLEAMACGLPVIATDCDYGNREILAPNLNKKEKVKEFTKEEFGILVPVGDKKYYNTISPLTQEEKELYKAMKTLIEDENLIKYYHQKSLDRIQNFKDNTDKWISCIEED